MDTERIAEELQALDLDPDHARVYTELVRLGPSKASDLATVLRIERTKVYRVLKDLQGRGFVAATLDRPTRFRAEPPEEVFDSVLDRKQRHVEEVAETRDRVLGTLRETYASDPREPPGNRWRLIKGRVDILERTHEMLTQAEQELIGVSTHRLVPEDAPPVERIREAFLDRARSGVDIRVVYETDPERLSEYRKTLQVPNLDIRHMEPEGFCRFFTVDRREILTWMVRDPSDALAAQGDVAIWTDARDYIAGQRMLFEALWDASQEIEIPAE